MGVGESLVFLIREFSRHRLAICQLVAQELRARYAGSALGIFWSVLQPLIQLAVLYFVFSSLLKVRLNGAEGELHFALWLVAGMLPWWFFSEVIQRAPLVILGNASLIKKTVFPAEVLPLVNVVSGLVNHLIAISLFLVLLLVLGAGMSGKLLWLPLVVFLSSGFALGLSFVISSLNIFLRDIGQAVGSLLNIWFFLTPIIYPLDTIPGHVRRLYDLNPMVHVVQISRAALLESGELSIGGVAYLVVASVAMLFFGHIVFTRLRPAFAEVL